MREIDRYEKAGNSYIAYNHSGKPVGLITEVKSINTAQRRKPSPYDRVGAVARLRR